LHRSTQLQVLSWLAGLASLGAATKPTFDTILFATAFVFGTMLMHVRERLEGAQPAGPRIAGRVLGAVIAWAFVAVRHFTVLGAQFPVRLTSAMLIAAAVVPTGIVAIECALTYAARRRAPVARRDATD
jgi:hypothetical protein